MYLNGHYVYIIKFYKLNLKNLTNSPFLFIYFFNSLFPNLHYHFYSLSSQSFTVTIKTRVNRKLHFWSLGLIGFYIPKFQKFDFTSCSLIPLVIHALRLVFSIKWHICMLTYFIFAKLVPKLRHFNDDQAKSWHASKLRSFKPNAHLHKR